MGIRELASRRKINEKIFKRQPKIFFRWHRRGIWLTIPPRFVKAHDNVLLDARQLVGSLDFVQRQPPWGGFAEPVAAACNDRGK